MFAPTVAPAASQGVKNDRYLDSDEDRGSVRGTYRTGRPRPAVGDQWKPNRRPSDGTVALAFAPHTFRLSTSPPSISHSFAPTQPRSRSRHRKPIDSFSRALSGPMVAVHEEAVGFSNAAYCILFAASRWEFWLAAGPRNKARFGATPLAKFPHQVRRLDLENIIRTAGSIRADINIVADGRPKGPRTIIFEALKNARQPITIYHRINWYGRTFEVGEVL
ncbi:hypothetical protein D9619_007706 [Psilocybe cf. subviscida]|uniref:Uncharacterized protein n=1 Tax=Psilocybe cf. subviscida TaxID=2480587 RepID=A0A8H5ESP9_9AGAR|nr:hypothetical protein D9619_007706 [Psilocybe cf. subviscida]